MEDARDQDGVGASPSDLRRSTTEPDRQLRFLEELVEEHAAIAGDVLEIGAETWAIHGSIGVDGDVIVAEYATQEQARSVLAALHAAEERRTGDGSRRRT